MTMTIGSKRVIYRNPDGSRYHPDGIQLPADCPRNGFTFNAQLDFQDGSTTAARTSVRCPPRGPTIALPGERRDSEF